MPPPTLLDRIVAWVNPVAALRRTEARVRRSAIEASVGGYRGGDKARRQVKGWQTASTSPDGALLWDLPTMRERSRDLARNTPMALGAIDTITTNVVGPGIKLKPQIDRELLGLDDAAADAWERQAKRLWTHFVRRSDFAAETDFWGQQFVALHSVLEAGDVLVILTQQRRSGDLFGLKVQLVEAERISNPNRQQDRAGLSGGVEIDPATGRTLAYHVSNRYPLDRKVDDPPEAWTRVPAFNPRTGERTAILLKDSRRPGASRGAPLLAPVVEALKQLADYTDAELMAAVINACFAVVSKTETGDPLPTTGEDAPAAGGLQRWEITYEPGMVLEGLGPNESVESFSPTRPNEQFDPFFQAIVRQIAVGIGLSYELLIRHFTASYSASRGAMLEVWKFFRRRRSWIAGALCQPVYEAVIGEAVERGYLSAPGWNDPLMREAWLGADWIGPAPGSLDPEKENRADEIAEDRGWKTAEEITAEKTGGDWEMKYGQRVKEQRMRVAGGLPVSVPAGPAQPAQTPAQQRDDGEETEETDPDSEDEEAVTDE